MLFVCELVSHEMASVVDTDDGLEEVHYTKDIVDMVRELNLDIKGVKFERHNGLTFGEVTPYQHPDMMSKLQIRFNMAYGVLVKTYKSTITGINWDSINQPVTLKLSDFGKICSSCLFRGNSGRSRYPLTIVVDKTFTDRTMSVSAFSGVPTYSNVNISIDCREAIDYGMVYEIYAMSDEYNAGGNFSVDDIIDIPERRSQILGRL